MEPVGSPTPLAPLPHYHSIRLSPDGRKVAADGQGVYVLDLGSGSRVPVASRGGSPVWSPDGSKIAYSGARPEFFIRRADGTGEVQVLSVPGSGFTMATSWSPDGKWIAATSGAQLIQSNYDIWLFDERGEARAFTTTPGRDAMAAFSPDGKWVAYHSDQSGRFEVYVAPFPGPGKRVAVSAGGGTTPVWKRDGSELYYRQDTAVMAVSITTEPTFSAGAPRFVLDGPYWLDPTAHLAFDVFDNGDLLLIDTGQANEIHVVQNWVEELKQLVPRD